MFEKESKSMAQITERYPQLTGMGPARRDALLEAYARICRKGRGAIAARQDKFLAETGLRRGCPRHWAIFLEVIDATRPRSA